jgi:hypothetical protein
VKIRTIILIPGYHLVDTDDEPMDWDELDPTLAEELCVVRKNSGENRVDKIDAFANIAHLEQFAGRLEGIIVIFRLITLD